jgi:DNA-binding response OmpR family regulator
MQLFSKSIDDDVRPSPAPEPRVARPLSAGPLVLDLGLFVARFGERVLPLTRIEFDLLAYLMRNQERVVSQRELLRELTGSERSAGTSAIPVHVSRLRAKLGEGAHWIQTVRSRGFRFDAAPEQAASLAQPDSGPLLIESSRLSVASEAERR